MTAVRPLIAALAAAAAALALAPAAVTHTRTPLPLFVPPGQQPPTAYVIRSRGLVPDWSNITVARHAYIWVDGRGGYRADFLAACGEAPVRGACARWVTQKEPPHPVVG